MSLAAPSRPTLVREPRHEQSPRNHAGIHAPVPEAADLATRAVAANMPLAEYLGFHILSSAYGLLHPDVRAFMRRAMAGVYGPAAEPVQAVGEPGAPGYGESDEEEEQDQGD